MNHDLLKTIIFDQHEIIKNSNIVNRDYSFEENGNYVLVGLRRAGKSTLLYKIVLDLIDKGIDWNQIIYINFEDERLSEFTLNDFNDIISVSLQLSDKKSYYFFDEIQNIDGWEKFARRLADSKERVYINGSNARMLSGEIETTLGGRYFSKYIYPYNFQEYLRANNIEFNKSKLLQTKYNANVKQLCNCYFIDGGFPETLQYKVKREYISNVYQKVLLGDIVARNNIRNEQTIRILMKKLAEVVCNDISYSKLENVIKSIGYKISKNSIIDYIQYASEAYLIFKVNNYYANFSEKESIGKYYFTDNGILNLFLDDKKSKLLENIVAIKLKQLYQDKFYYLKSSRTNIDIDFYVKDKELLIQVAYSIEEIKAKQREIEELIKASKLMDNIKEYIIVTYEQEDIIEINGIEIKVIPLYKFLLEIY